MNDVNSSYVDDLLRAGTNEFKKGSSKTYRYFETSGEQQQLPLAFAGLNITHNSNNSFAIEQTFYHKKFEELDI